MVIHVVQEPVKIFKCNITADKIWEKAFIGHKDILSYTIGFNCRITWFVLSWISWLPNTFNLSVHSLYWVSVMQIMVWCKINFIVYFIQTKSIFLLNNKKSYDLYNFLLNCSLLCCLYCNDFIICFVNILV